MNILGLWGPPACMADCLFSTPLHFTDLNCARGRWSPHHAHGLPLLAHASEEDNSGHEWIWESSAGCKEPQLVFNGDVRVTETLSACNFIPVPFVSHQNLENVGTLRQTSWDGSLQLQVRAGTQQPHQIQDRLRYCEQSLSTAGARAGGNLGSPLSMCCPLLFGSKDRLRLGRQASRCLFQMRLKQVNFLFLMQERSPQRLDLDEA